MNRLDKITGVCNDAIGYFGTSRRVDKAMEEMGELSASLLQYKYGRADVDSVTEEIADVIVIAYQLALIFGKDDVSSKIDDKIERLQKMIPKAMPKKEYYGG